jgi:4-oxalocrotonate tautomerase
VTDDIVSRDQGRKASRRGSGRPTIADVAKTTGLAEQEVAVFFEEGDTRNGYLGNTGVEPLRAHNRQGST